MLVAMNHGLRRIDQLICCRVGYLLGPVKAYIRARVPLQNLVMKHFPGNFSSFVVQSHGNFGLKFLFALNVPAKQARKLGEKLRRKLRQKLRAELPPSKRAIKPGL